MNYRSTLAPFALAFLGLLATGCHTMIPIRSTRPGPIAIGSTNQLVLIKGTGRRSAREETTQQVISQCRSGGYFSVNDRSEDPIFVKIAGGQVHIEGGDEAFADPNRAGVKIDVLELDCDRSESKIEVRNYQTGVTTVRRVPIQRGTALLAITLFDARGRAYVSEREYEGLCETRNLSTSRSEVTNTAIASAVTRFLSEITPRQVRTRVRLDDEDKGQKAIIATAKAGNVAQAAQDAKTYAEAHPNSPSAAFNLAVFLDAMGQYEEALAWYDRAMQKGTKGFYAGARAQCARRLADTAALRQTPTTPKR